MSECDGLFLTREEIEAAWEALGVMEIEMQDEDRHQLLALKLEKYLKDENDD